jgi:hypothetical protein
MRMPLSAERHDGEPIVVVNNNNRCGCLHHEACGRDRDTHMLLEGHNGCQHADISETGHTGVTQSAKVKQGKGQGRC